MGITIGKRVGTAVARNRLKRRIKAWFRAYPGSLPTGLRMNLIARKGAAELSWAQLSEELDGILKSIK